MLSELIDGGDAAASSADDGAQVCAVFGGTHSIAACAVDPAVTGHSQVGSCDLAIGHACLVAPEPALERIPPTAV